MLPGIHVNVENKRMNWGLVMKRARTLMSRGLYWAIALLFLGLTTSACAIPQVNAEDRLYLDVSLEYLDEFQMPKQTFEDTPVGGLSAIAYDPAGDRLYVLSDDRGSGAPSRFYTMQMVLDQTNPDQPQIDTVAIDSVTVLRDEFGERLLAGTVDPEGLAVSPQQTVIISSEGVARDGIAPFIDEFDIATGKRLQSFPIPERYVPQTIEGALSGIQDNRGFEALTLSAAGTGVGRIEPFRVFAGLEEPLQQDLPEEPTDGNTLDTSSPASFMPGRIAHYVVSDSQSTLIAEHLYPIEPKPFGAVNNGLAELLSIDQAGHFLSLERSFGVMGFGAKIFQVAIASATDTSQINRFDTNVNTIQPVYKQLELDLLDLDIDLDNLEGMTLGPRLSDGSKSLILVSDDNFNENQITQWLLFRILGM